MRYWRRLLAYSLLFSCMKVLAADIPLRFATLEYPPYIINTDQGAQGLSIDIVSTAFSRMGRSIKIEFYPISRGQYMLLNGEVDGFFSIKKTPEREATMLFPQKALINQDYVFFVRKDSRWRFTGDFDSLRDARIGIVSATSYGNRFDNAAQTGKFQALDPATNYVMTFRKLLAGRVDAVICSRLVGLYYLETLNGLNDVTVSGPPVETTISYLAFTLKKDYKLLSKQFDKTIESMERDGTLNRLINAYQLPQARIPSKIK